MTIHPGVLLGGKYRLSKPLGEGGMATVWLATNVLTGAEVALKMIQTAGHNDARARLQREAHVVAALSHRGIVRVYDLVELGGPDAGIAVVMEHLRGSTLAEHLEARGRLSMHEALAIFLPVLTALAHAHAAGIVHRDLKPENIFLATEPDGLVTPKILDFGICKQRRPGVYPITRDGEIVGTPAYMSPEQLRGDPMLDARSDIFSAGIVLYQMLSGTSPFERGAVQPTVSAVLETEPPPIRDLNPAIWGVVRRALRKSSAQRFETVEAMAAALRSSAEATIADPPPSQRFAARGVFSTTPRRGDRRTTRALLYAAAVALAGAALATSSIGAADTATELRTPRIPSAHARVVKRLEVPSETVAAPEVNASVPSPVAPQVPRARKQVGLARDPGF